MYASSKTEPVKRGSIFLPRLVLGTFLFTSICIPTLLQPALTRLYTHLHHSSFYRLSCFETIETILCYAVIEVLFTYKFGKNPHLRIDIRGPGLKTNSTSIDENGNPVTSPKPKVPKMRRPSKRLGEMFIYAAPLLLMDFTMIKKFARVPISDIRASGGYDPLPLNSINHNLTTSPLTLHNTAADSISSSFLLPTLHNFTLHSPLQLTRALPPPFPPPTSRLLALQLLLSLLIYDSFFFLLHLALHRLPLLSPLHLHHHSHSEIHPQVTNRLSIPERLSLVLLANFSLNVIGSHVLTRTLFVPVFVYLLVEVHSGLDLEWGYEKVLPWGWGSGARVHARHHRFGAGQAGGGGLAPFFGWWDHALETWDRWRARRRRRRVENIRALKEL